MFCTLPLCGGGGGRSDVRRSVGVKSVFGMCVRAAEYAYGVQRIKINVVGFFGKMFEFSTLVSAPSSSRISDFSPGVAASAVLLSLNRRFGRPPESKTRITRTKPVSNVTTTDRTESAFCSDTYNGASVFHKGTRGIKRAQNPSVRRLWIFFFLSKRFYLFVFLLFSLTRRSTHIRPGCRISRGQDTSRLLR